MFSSVVISSRDHISRCLPAFHCTDVGDWESSFGRIVRASWSLAKVRLQLRVDMV